MSDSLKEQPLRLRQDELEMSARWTAVGNTLLQTASALNAVVGEMETRLKVVNMARRVIDTLSADWEGVSFSFQEFVKGVDGLFVLATAKIRQLEKAMDLSLDLVTDDQHLIGEIVCAVDARRVEVAASLASELREAAIDCEHLAAKSCLRVISDDQAQRDLLAEGES